MHPAIPLTVAGLITFKRVPARIQEAAFIGIIGFSVYSLGKLAWDLIPANEIDDAIAPN